MLLRSFVFASVLLAGCKSTASGSLTKDLQTGDQSNVAAPGGGANIALSDIAALKVLPNTKVPKGAFVSLLVGPDGDNNYAFVKSLYQYIARINRDSGLIPTVGVANPTPEQLQNQEITLAVLVPTDGAAAFAQLVSDLGGTNGTLPYLLRLDGDQAASDLWMQDWGEFAAVTLKGASSPEYLVVDTYRNETLGTPVFSPSVFSQAFHIPFIHLGDATNNQAQYGGNIGATPGGTLYMGDSIDDPSYSVAAQASGLFDALKQLGNPNAIKVSTNWLMVGHVDEYLTYVPSVGPCRAALLYSRPLEGLTTVLTSATDAEFAKFAQEIAGQVLLFPTDNSAPKTVGTLLSRDDLTAAMSSFLRTGAGGTGALPIDTASYDVTKADPDFPGLADATTPMLASTFATFAGDKAKLARFYVWRNIVDQQLIESSVAKLANDGEACVTVEPLPSPFMPYFGMDPTGSEVVYRKDTELLPAMVNSLILRDQAIVPDPGIEALRQATTQRLGKHLGSTATDQKVHFIDDGIYHGSQGEVHCGTNVLREMSLDFNPPASSN